MIFAGEFRVRVDTTGRIAVPEAFKPAFAGGIVLARGFEPCILAFTHEAWQQVGKDLGQFRLTRRASRRVARFTFSSAHAGEVDRQGRLSLPAALAEYAGLKDAVVIVGAGPVVEIWAPEAWEAERRELMAGVRDLAASSDASSGAPPEDGADTG